MHKTLSQGGGLVLGAWGCCLLIECFSSSHTVLNLTQHRVGVVSWLKGQPVL